MDDLVGKILARCPAALRPGLRLLGRTVKESGRDRLPGLAAEVAFFLILSVPALLLALVGVLGYVGDLLGAEVVLDLKTQLLEGANNIFSDRTVEQVVAPTLDDVVNEGRADVASLGLLFTLWTASRAVNVILGAITIAYDLEPSALPGWRRRLFALVITIVGILAGLVIIPLLLVGPGLGAAIAEPLGLAESFSRLWQALYWPIVAVFGVGALSVLYHMGTPWWTPWRRDVPGGVLALLVWLAGSFGLRAYSTRTIEANAVYQQISAPLVVLLWLYVVAFALLLGAEFNAEIERMWPTEETRRHRRGPFDLLSVERPTPSE